MPKIKLSCYYCGHKWEKFVYNSIYELEEKCIQCKDYNIKIVTEETGDVFGYENTKKEDAYIKGNKK